ncbi:MAG: FAD-binding oxidoreductase [Planctomycetota bacterium JB042]
MIERFRRLLGDDAVWELGEDGEVARELGIDLAFAAAPADEEECAAALRAAAERRLGVVPWGGGRHQRIGRVPSPVAMVLVTTEMAGVVQHDVEDQTVVVRAGTRLRDLLAVVRDAGQMLPLDPWGLDRATVGGVVAAGINGPLRTGFGLPRDHLLGTRVANPDGTVTRSGGRLVKNVTGFDLHRLLHGSLGTLGVLTEVAFRLRPRPEREGTVAARFDDLEGVDRLFAASRLAGEELASFAVAPAATLAAAGAEPIEDATDEEWIVLARALGAARETSRVVARLSELAEAAGATTVREPAAGEQGPIWTAVRELGPRLDPDGGGVVLSLQTAPMLDDRSAMGGFVEAAVAQAAGCDLRPHVVLEPSLGEVRLHFAAPPPDRLLSGLRRLADRGAGRFLRIVSAPAPWRRTRDPWFGPLPAERLQRRVKAALDPGDVLSPGRIVTEVRT